MHIYTVSSSLFQSGKMEIQKVLTKNIYILILIEFKMMIERL